MQNKFNKIIRIFNNQSPSAGFTLIELLLAASLTTIVVSLAGLGLVSMVSADKDAKSENDRRMELNRALDFIADEVRQARSINRIPAPVESRPSSTDIIEAGTLQSILVLELPNATQSVVYHIAKPRSSTPWLGPRVIYRWGPSLDDDGTYKDLDDSSTWSNQPLVDIVEDSKPSPNPICGDGWAPQPSAPNRKGFYVCVDTNSRIAQINVLGRLEKAYGTPTQPYKVSSKVFARPNDIALGAAGNGLFDVTGGLMTFSQPTALNFRVIGSSISCGAGPTAPKISVTTKVLINTDSDPAYEEEKTVDSSEPLSLGPGTTNKVAVQGTALAKSCVGKNLTYDSTNTSQVFALRNGDPIPDFTPFNGQTTPKKYLEEFTDPVTNKISIANNEVIYLFELGSQNKDDATFDSQDLVVLATAEPR